MTKETVEHIIYSLELAQKQREIGLDLPPFLTPEEHQIVIAYWKNILETVKISDGSELKTQPE